MAMGAVALATLQAGTQGIPTAATIAARVGAGGSEARGARTGEHTRGPSIGWVSRRNMDGTSSAAALAGVPWGAETSAGFVGLVLRLTSTSIWAPLATKTAILVLLHQVQGTCGAKGSGAWQGLHCAACGLTRNRGPAGGPCFSHLRQPRSCIAEDLHTRTEVCRLRQCRQQAIPALYIRTPLCTALGWRTTCTSAAATGNLSSSPTAI
jgi:hypothetical protein